MERTTHDLLIKKLGKTFERNTHYETHNVGYYVFDLAHGEKLNKIVDITGVTFSFRHRYLASDYILVKMNRKSLKVILMGGYHLVGNVKSLDKHCKWV